MAFFYSLIPQAHWLLRLAILSVFLYHGLDKFADLQGFAEMGGMPVGLAVMVALAETVGSLLVFAGGFTSALLTRLGALILMPVMLGAIGMVHWGQWAFMATETHPMGGMEFQVTLLLVLLHLFVVGNRTPTPREATAA